MKKIVLLISASILFVGDALAFNAFGHQSIAALADKYLTDNAKKEIKAILKTDMVKASTWLNTLRKKQGLTHTNGWHTTTLDANGKSTTMAENDGIVQLEKSIAVFAHLYRWQRRYQGFHLQDLERAYCRGQRFLLQQDLRHELVQTLGEQVCRALHTVYPSILRRRHRYLCQREEDRVREGYTSFLGRECGRGCSPCARDLQAGRGSACSDE